MGGLPDFQKIAQEMRKSVAYWYNAEVQIVDPEVRHSEWDPVTNEYDFIEENVLWSGPARIQPIGLTGARMVDLNVMQGAIKNIRVQVPYDESLPLIRKGLQVRVVSGGEDDVWANMRMIVNSAVNSSYGWNRTIECELDTRSPAESEGS